MIATSTKKRRDEGFDVSNHKHCVICGGVVPPEKDPPMCEGTCEEEFMKRQKRSKTFNMVWMLMIFALIALMMFSFLGFGAPPATP
ncbi:MAG: DUF2116 family Zn-ribbon domain-containing protein [Candidatus Nezhaarchaeota archaeon]|nr:DUF2116 family Zn-ribbon domain-containing protein [Candidatus Nezhaarchaeota archaeon]